MAGDTPGRECPHDDVGIRPQMGTVRMSDDRVPSTNIESPYGGGASSLPGATGSLLPVKFPAAPVLLADGPQLGSWQVAVVRVDETPVGDTSGRKCPHGEQNRQWPSDMSELHGGPGIAVCGGDVNLPGSYWKCSSSGAGWGLPSGWCSEPCWLRWPSCCRLPRWPV